MEPRDAVRALAVTRIAFGAGMVLAPGLAAGPFLGADAATPGATVIGRALGARDALMGAMVLHTADNPTVAKRWISSCAAIDVVDGVAALVARDGLPRVRGAAFVAIALGSAVAHGLLAQSVAGAAPGQSPAPASA